MGKIRKSLFTLFLAVVLVWGSAAFITYTRAASTGDQAVSVGGRAAYDIYDEDDMVTDSNIGIATQQSTKAYVDGIAKKTLSGATIVYIDDLDDLSSWSGQASVAGVSYFNASPGYHYIVDFQAIVDDGMKGSFSGVSAILASADSTSNTEGLITFEIGETSGTSGFYNSDTSGTTVLFIWPYPGGSGLTAYHLPAASYASAYRSGCTPETLVYEYSTGTYGLGSGVSYWELDRYGETVTFRLQTDSYVSAYPVAKHVNN